jgi:hypothetical protein
MGAAYPMAWILLTAFVWFYAAAESSRLLKAFKRTYPKEAERDIPYAFASMRHPAKLFFFFRARSLPLLKADSRVWKIRQRLKLLLVLSAVLPSLGLVCYAWVAIIAGR